MEYSTILVAVDRGVATVTLNRPEFMNAWNLTMANEMNQAMLSLDRDDSVRAIVVTGAGRAFCAGSDLKGASFTEGDNDYQETSLFLSTMPWQIGKPVIAAINGHAIGVGITYAMSCDIRFVAEDAKIQFAFVRRGIIPELASHVIVARVAGLSNAADLILTGRAVKGRELADMRLASQALPAKEVLPASIERAREFLKAAPVSVAISKRLLWEGLTSSVPDMYRREISLFEWICRQRDAAEGISSFLEKRDPKWTLSVTDDLPPGLEESRRIWERDLLKK
jgi:enoyl-CoA hydratase/carnithine racemase